MNRRNLLLSAGAAAIAAAPALAAATSPNPEIVRVSITSATHIFVIVARFDEVDKNKIRVCSYLDRQLYSSTICDNDDEFHTVFEGECRLADALDPDLMLADPSFKWVKAG